MTTPFRYDKLLATILAVAATGLVTVRHAGAEVADLAPVPLANAPSDAVLPNLMYVLDDSGSMAWNYMPDQIFRMSNGTLLYNCKKCTTTSCGGGPGGTSSTSGQLCGNTGDPNANSSTAPTDYGEAPFYSTNFNKIWYNPDITYAPGVDSLGTSFGNASPTSASDDHYLSGPKTNLVNAFSEVIYCNTNKPTGADLTNPARCRKNGIHNVSAAQPWFLYWGDTSGTGIGYPDRTFYYKVLIKTSNPHYFAITAHEYCSDASLVNCALATAAGASPGDPNTIAAPLRWCKTAADAVTTSVVSGNSGGTPRCQKKFDTSTYKYPRYGRFNRVDIVGTTGSYPKGAGAVRTDCASATTCTYNEEVQNFANWWTYYSNRLSLFKTATGRAFLPIADRYRIGFITINPNTPVSSSKFLPVDQFNSTQKTAWYNKLYAQSTNGSTPNRTALHRVGRYYAGLTDGINQGMTPDPMQFSCQQNFALLTTDGYYNDDFTSIGNQDNVNSGFTTRGWGAYDGGLNGASNTLADVAAYYYKTDLRTTGVLAPNNVRTSIRDQQPAQHMVTFSLGLGLEGFMDYQPDYETSPTGDFANIKAGTNNACSWTTGTCNWPVPAVNQPSTLDDLWHAAVNGRGTYFSASDPNSLSLGLQTALTALDEQTAAAAASATSSPNITETDNYIYSSTFRTAKWDGEIVAQRIDTVSGLVLPPIVWSAQAQLDGQTTDTSDSRNIFTIDESAGGKKKPFKYGSLTNAAVGSIAAERAYFDNKCTNLSQCALLTIAQKVIANDGDSLVNYLRGWRGNERKGALETVPTFRAREHILGDPVNSTPGFMSSPKLFFADPVTPSYADFKIANATRQSVLFIAANDGMLHALNGDTGAEMWAYVPRIVMPKLNKLATANWGAVHEYSVDGSPELMDVYIGGAWKTILIAGLNGGGRGYYALDVTSPANPTVLWEICSDPTICAISDPDIGYTFSNPIMTKRKRDGKWVVFLTSGINNVSPGTGRGFLYVVDIASGTILQKIDTGAGDTTTPSGFNRISAYADNFTYDNTGTHVYGGDLLGNVWKFDTSAATPSAFLLATLRDASGKPQSVTTRPELGLIGSYRVVFIGTGRYLGTDDLVDPATLAPPLPWAYQQTFYAIKDNGVTFNNFRTGNVVQNTIVPSGPTARSTTTNPVDWAVKDGWFVDLNPGGDSPGERVNVDPLLVQGTLVFVGNVPNNSACTVGGDSWIYQFDYKTGQFVPSAPLNQAGQKFTGQITVGLVVVRLPSGIFKGIATGATGTKTPFAVNIGGGGGSARRISWRELMLR